MAICLGLSASAAPLVTQTLRLRAGWNAVWLEVTPVSQDPSGGLASPEGVFSDPAITKVAAFFSAFGPVEFVSQPEDAFNQDSWRIWYRKEEDGDPAKQSNLGGILGQRGYLVYASKAVIFPVRGRVGFQRLQWQPDSYNLVGFGVVAGSEPTFDEFFSDSAAHRSLNAFRLGDDGEWVSVGRTDPIRAGEAYWVYCAGPSSFQGPLHVEGSDREGLHFGPNQFDREIVLANATSGRTLRPLLERVTESGHFEWVTVLPPREGDFARIEGEAVVKNTLSPIAPRQSTTVTLRAKARSESPPANAEQLYRLVTGAGTYFWLPASVSWRPPEPIVQGTGPSDGYRGLWVGDIKIDQASRLTARGASPKMEPTGDKLASRILVHVDSSGRARLLKQVTLMRRKRASETVDPGLVLVTDERLIPNLEGIIRRGGKWVGQRLESVAYDMPRRSSTRNPPVPPPVPPDNFDPSTLEEDYLESLELDGSVGPGRTLITKPSSLVLDPWHRTNPFRHAYHPDHRQGRMLVRELDLRFDDATSEQAKARASYGVRVLSGTYRESVEGLTKSGERLWMSGSFELHRISDVGQLNGI